MSTPTFKDLDKVFAIEEIDDSQVIIKVNAKDPLTVAKYPFLESQYAFINITRGCKQILTVIYDDGHTFDFHWGGGSMTIIGENLTKLKQAVLQFIDENAILLDYTGETVVTEISIYYNDNYKRWQLNIGTCHYWSKTATSVDEMIAEASKWVHAKSWDKSTASTGIDIWYAKDYELSIK